ncbi:MAG TPA: tetratricopeptide repeat protein [Terriglobales bacterium]|jgi:TolB-like protein/DNA-binding winged helix-turn-helix (wHTH) protein/Tfp pilus assembly protein PilF|nr:tetratricopeptide repeat protein [Terriglobales bacterium]
MAPQTQESLQETMRFDVYEANLRSGELRKHGLRVPLEEKPFQALVVMLRHANEVVTREELRHQLWPADVFIDFTHSLNTVIAKARRALNDTAENPRFIETVGRHGYRFIAKVVIEMPKAATPPDLQVIVKTEGVPAHPPGVEIAPWPNSAPAGSAKNGLARTGSFKAGVAVGATLIVLVILTIGVSNPWGWRDRLLGRPTHAIRSLAVLPLENLSGDPAQEYFADGMTDELTTDLAQIGSLRVISRTSSMQYKYAHKSLSQIAQELNVDAVVEGSVERTGNHVKIRAQLIEGPTDRHLWAESYESDLRDVLSLQGNVARDIARKIQVELTPTEKPAQAASTQINPAAYDAYLLGRYYWEKRNQQGLKKSIDYFNQAIAIDPNYALAYSGLADSYHVIGNYGIMPADEAVVKSEAMAQKALSIENNLAEAHAVLADSFTTYHWDWAAAEPEYKRAIELNPNYSTVRQWYAEYLNAMGRTQEALVEIKQAQEVDPVSLTTNAVMGRVFFMARQYDAAIAQCKKTIAMNPSHPRAYVYLARVYEQKGMYQEAWMNYHKSRVLMGYEPDSQADQAPPKALDTQSFWKQRLAWAQTDLKHGRNASFDLAVAYTNLGDKNRAFQWLEKSYQEHSGWMAELKINPMNDPLRSDPRFQSLLKRMKLE